MKKIKWLLSGFTIMAAIALVFAFTPVKKHAVKKTDGTEYVFTGTSVNDVNNAAMYEKRGTQDPNCVGSNLPCIINVPEGETLEQYLEEHDASYILANAVATKN